MVNIRDNHRDQHVSLSKFDTDMSLCPICFSDYTTKKIMKRLVTCLVLLSMAADSLREYCIATVTGGALLMLP